jgi:hypothetical protein
MLWWPCSEPLRRGNASEGSLSLSIRQMRTELDRWIEETNDQGRFPESPKVAEYYEQLMSKIYGDRVEAPGKRWRMDKR